MTCLRCNGSIYKERIFAENEFIDDIYCVSCGERFFKNIPVFQKDKGYRRKKQGIKLSNDFNKL